MKKFTFLLALCYLVACQAPEASEILVQPTDIEGLVEVPRDKNQDDNRFRSTSHPGQALANRASFSPNQGSPQEAPSHEPSCEYKGTVIETPVTSCGLLIRLDNGTQLEPQNLDEPLKPGQRVILSYLESENQNSICNAGLVVDLICLTLLDEVDIETSHSEAVRTDTP